MLLISSVAQAQKFDVLKSNSSYFAQSSGTTSRDSLGDSSSTRNTGFEILFGSESAPFKSDGLSWPPLPRFWGMEGHSDYYEQKIGAGFTGAINAEVNFSFKYEVTTVFHYLGSLKMIGRTSEAPLNPLEPSDFEKVFSKDPQTVLDYFNVTDQNPIVGMCQYEIALYHGKTASGGITWFLKMIAEGGRVNFSRLSVYSRLFNLKPRGEYDEHSLKWYKETECENRFKTYVKPFVDEAFAYRAIEYNAYGHPSNTCTLGSRTIEGHGDESCFGHREKMNSTIKKSTVSRCEIQKNGSSQCVLKAKENMNCPMYMDRDGNYTDKYQGLYRDATLAHFGQQCDKGLVCKMQKEPLRIGSFILWPGRATCQKK